MKRTELHQLIKDQNEKMVLLAKSGYDESDMEDLLVLTHMAIEFYWWLKDANTDSLDRYEADENSETLFVAFDAFRHTYWAYDVLIGRVASNIDWGDISVPSLRKLIILTYERFDVESNFLKKCRFLLNLYKVELVFAGLMYGNGKKP